MKYVFLQILFVTLLNVNTLLTLIPKEADSIGLKKIRPIALTNFSLKIFSMALNNRLINISKTFVSPNQTVFIKRIYILERVVAGGGSHHAF
jgi:hypothetical protein